MTPGSRGVTPAPDDPGSRGMTSLCERGRDDRAIVPVATPAGREVRRS